MGMIWNDHKGFGKQIFILAKNELIKTYKGAVIGPLWAVVKPVFTLFVYWFAFAIGVRGGAARDELGNGTPYFIFLMVGFVPWFFIMMQFLWVLNQFEPIVSLSQKFHSLFLQ